MVADSPKTPVALVIQRRVRDDTGDAFAVWEARVAARLKSWPGFISHEAVPPSPPVNVDWTIVQHFADAVHAWLQSSDRAALLEEVRDLLIGQEEVHLLPELGQRPARMSSVLIAYQVPSGEEAEFLEWQRRIQIAQSRFPGFIRHKIERPIPGVHDDWLIVLSFDSEPHLQSWLDSAERRTLIDEGGRFGAKFKVSHSNHGFDFWFPDGTGPTMDWQGIFKSNLLVLLMLYPIVFLWNYLVDGPLVQGLAGAPFWLALFIGNIVSTQLLGFWAAPRIFKDLRLVDAIEHVCLPPDRGIRDPRDSLRGIHGSLRLPAASPDLNGAWIPHHARMKNNLWLTIRARPAEPCLRARSTMGVLISTKRLRCN